MHERELWTAIYAYTARAMGGLGFLNYGYAADPPIPLEPADEPERYGAQLYDRVVGDFRLEGRRVVEVGCGRGAGADFLVRYRAPRAFVGVELSFDNLAILRRRFAEDARLSFVQGDANDVPLATASADAVVNVESSHCYPSRERFFAEVRRVLAPGGAFLFTDFWEPDRTPKADLEKAGFVVDREEDVTERVVEALERDGERRRLAAEAAAEENRRKHLASWSGVPGGAIWTNFKTREWIYRIHRGRVPG